MSGCGPTRTTGALQQVGSYLGYSGREADVVARAALDPKPPFVFDFTIPTNGKSSIPGILLAPGVVRVPPRWVGRQAQMAPVTPRCPELSGPSQGMTRVDAGATRRGPARAGGLSART